MIMYLWLLFFYIFNVLSSGAFAFHKIATNLFPLKRVSYKRAPLYARGRTRDDPRSNIKIGRVIRVFRDELSDILTNLDVKAQIYPNEELMKTLSIVDIEMSPDYSYAKVYITVFGNSVEKRQVYVWLNENIGQVRYSLSKRLKNLRKIPQVDFHLADTQGTYFLNDELDDLSKEYGTFFETYDDDDIDFEEVEEEDDDDIDFEEVVKEDDE